MTTKGYTVIGVKVFSRKYSWWDSPAKNGVTGTYYTTEVQKKQLRGWLHGEFQPWFWNKSFWNDRGDCTEKVKARAENLEIKTAEKSSKSPCNPIVMSARAEKATWACAFWVFGDFTCVVSYLAPRLIQGVPKVRSSNFMRYNFWSKLYSCMKFLQDVYCSIEYMYSEFQ